MATTPKPPTNAGFSIAQSGARLTAGKAGLYIKTESKVLITTTADDTVGLLPPLGTKKDNDGNLLTANLLTATGVAYTHGAFFGFSVQCPSARIRCSFGVSQVAGDLDPNSRDSANRSNLLEYVNVFPGVYVKDAICRVDTAGPDNSGVANGQALFPYPQFAATENGRNVFHEGDFIYGGYDGTAANSGGRNTANGKGLPFAYEALSGAKVYRVRGGVFADDSDRSFAVPLVAWASWEIIDPRTAEDSQALLADCILVASPTPIIFL